MIDILLCCIVAVSFYVLLYNNKHALFLNNAYLFYKVLWEYWIYSVSDSRTSHNVRNLHHIIHTTHIELGFGETPTK